MKFSSTAREPDGPLHGEISPATGASREFCRRYRVVATALLSGGDVDIHPVVLDPWPFDDGASPLRRVYDSEEDGEPNLHAAALAGWGLQASADDLVVAIPPDIAMGDVSEAELVLTVVMDAASWEADNTENVSHLSWTGPEIKRAAIAARLLRGAEAAGLVNARDAADGYMEICAIAMDGLSSRRHEDNGEVLLAREFPGLVTLLHRLVEDARTSPPPLAPLSAQDAGRDAMRSLSHALASGTGIAPSQAA